MLAVNIFKINKYVLFSSIFYLKKEFQFLKLNHDNLKK